MAAPGQPWIRLDAGECYSVQPPGFVWAGTARLGRMPVARARDMYADGTGRMLVKVASLWPVAGASGDQMDQAEMMRYPSEMKCFPAAFLAGNISFEAVDDSSARVTFCDHGRTAAGTLVFDEEGRLTDLVAQRYRTPGAIRGAHQLGHHPARPAAHYPGDDGPVMTGRRSRDDGPCGSSRRAPCGQA